MTRLTLDSLPGMGCELRMTVSSELSLSQRFSPAAMSASAESGSPWLPVEMTQVRAGSRSVTSAMSTSLSSGIFSRPMLRASLRFFFIDSPSVATVRPSAMATSQICWMRWMWLAKQAMTMRRPLWAAKRSASTLPTERSDAVWPGSSALVESARSSRMPGNGLSSVGRWRAISPMVARSVRRPSTGVRSSFQSPLCRIVPCGVWNAVAKPWGTEWVTGRNSTSNGPIFRRSPSVTGMSSVRPSSPASSMRCRASPRVRAEP